MFVTYIVNLHLVDELPGFPSRGTLASQKVRQHKELQAKQNMLCIVFTVFSEAVEMVNGLHLYIHFSSLLTTQSAVHTIGHIQPIHTHSYTDAAGCLGGPTRPSEGANHSHTNSTAISNNLGFSVLPKDTLTCGLERQGIKLLLFRLVDEPLYLLSHRKHLNPSLDRVQIALSLVVYQALLGQHITNT